MNTNNSNGVSADTTNTNVENQVQNPTQGVETPKTFDDMLKESNYQSEFDRRIQKSLDTAKTKWEADMQAKQSEAEKLSKMKEDERNAYELEQARKKQEEAEAKLNAYELKEEAVKIANTSENRIDVSLLSLIDFSKIKAEQVEPTIKNIKKVFDNAVENEVNKRLKEPTPRTVLNTDNSTKTVSRTSY